MEAHAPFVVKEAPYVQPKATQMVVKVEAVAMNPLDWKIQTYAASSVPVKYPMIFGSDLAGTIVEVGAELEGFKVGDRVASSCHGLFTGHPECSAFQDYAVVTEPQTFRIPDHISFVDGSVIPLASLTAMAALYTEKFLGLKLPTQAPQRTGKWLLGKRDRRIFTVFNGSDESAD